MAHIHIREKILNDRLSDLGTKGDFSSLAKSLPDEMFLVKEVRGPIYVRNFLKQKKISQHFTHVLLQDAITDLGELNCQSSTHREQIEFLGRLENFIHKDENIQKPLTPDSSQNYQQLMIASTYTDYINEHIDSTIPVRDQLHGRLVTDNFQQKPREKINIPYVFLKSSNFGRQSQERVKSFLRKKALVSFAKFYNMKKSKKLFYNFSNVPYSKRINEQRLRKFIIFLEKIFKCSKRGVIKIRGKIMKRTFEPSKEIGFVKKELLTTLIDSIDEGNIELMLSTLHVCRCLMKDYGQNGKTAIQTIFSRLCQMDAGYEPMNIKLANTYEKMLDVLYFKGSDVNQVDCVERANGWAPMHYAAKYGCVKRLEWLLTCNADVNVLSSLEKISPLMIAGQRGNFEISYLLVRSNANLFGVKDYNGATTLHYAALGGNLTQIQFLVQCGCVSDKFIKNKNGETPLDVCLLHGFENCAEFLLKVNIIY